MVQGAGRVLLAISLISMLMSATVEARQAQGLVTTAGRLVLSRNAFPGPLRGYVLKTSASVYSIESHNAVGNFDAAAVYHRLGSYGSIEQEGALPAGPWKTRLIFLFATAFPSEAAATAARNFDAAWMTRQHCLLVHVSYARAHAITCSWHLTFDDPDPKNRAFAASVEAVAVEGNVEYQVVGLVESGTRKTDIQLKPAEALAGRDVALVAVREALHIQHLFLLSPASPPVPTSARPAPATKSVPSSASLIRFVSVSPAPVIDHQPATVTAQTQPGSGCSVVVVYSSGYTAKSYSLRATFTAGGNGLVSWSWTPDTKYPGPATATVACTEGAQSQTVVQNFTVQ